jgi:hypothetical protein
MVFEIFFRRKLRSEIVEEVFTNTFGISKVSTMILVNCINFFIATFILTNTTNYFEDKIIMKITY